MAELPLSWGWEVTQKDAGAPKLLNKDLGGGKRLDKFALAAPKLQILFSYFEV
jgi:hypothetical protein